MPEITAIHIWTVATTSNPNSPKLIWTEEQNLEAAVRKARGLYVAVSGVSYVGVAQ